MKFEEAMVYLRIGNPICRDSKPDFYLMGTADNVSGSFYLTLDDVLADDWRIC